MKKKIFFLLILLGLFVTVLTGCSQKKGQLVLATEAGFAPYEYYSGDKVVGVDIDIAKEIAKELDYELVIKDVAFDSIISEVKTDKSDIGAAGISFTEERAKQVDFTINYAESKQVIVVLNDSDIVGPNSLSNQRVAVQLGTVADGYLTDNYPNLEIVREKKFLAAVEDLKKHKVDAVVMDELPAKKLVTKDMKILTDPVVTDSYGMIVKKGNSELLNVANKVIERLKSEGKVDKYLLNHMGMVDNSSSNRPAIVEKFYQTIIYDGRYKYILKGLGNTLLIALGAVLLGVLLGIIISVIRNFHGHTGRLPILNLLAKAYVTIIRGTPVILQLMIIYYVIFANASINIVLVGILAFGINSGAYVAEIIRGGLNSVDKGQMEAGYALGLNYSSVMRYIVFPPAIRNILPALGNEFITLVKETSVGAYIGIIELTKASDIIASRTYDYFFPLIIIALIYLCITLVLSKLVGMMEAKLNNVRS